MVLNALRGIAMPWHRALAFPVDAHRDGPEGIPEVHLPLHQLAEAADLGGCLRRGVGLGMRAFGAELRHLEMDRILARPVVEQLAPGDVAGVTLGRHGGIRRVRPVLHLQRADVIAAKARGTLGREQDLEAAVGVHLDARTVEPAGLQLHAGAQFREVAGVAGKTAGAGLEDQVMRRLAPAGRGRLALPVPRIAHLAAQHVALAAIDRRIEVDRVRVVDGAAVEDAERVVEMRPHRILVEGTLDTVMHEAHQVAIALGEIALGRRRGHQLRDVDAVAGLLQRLDHLVPCRAQPALSIIAGFAHRHSPCM
jgi:hypothetical protein